MNAENDKKPYIAPAVEVVKLQHASCLLDGSCTECINDTLGMADTVKEDLA